MPSPQSMVPVKSAIVANVLASVKVPTTVVAGSAIPVWAVSRVAGPGGQCGVGDDGRAGEVVVAPPSSVTVTV